MKRKVKYLGGWSEIFKEGERVQLRKNAQTKKGVYSRAPETELWSVLKEASSLRVNGMVSCRWRRSLYD